MRGDWLCDEMKKWVEKVHSFFKETLSQLEFYEIWLIIDLMNKIPPLYQNKTYEILLKKIVNQNEILNKNNINKNRK